MFSAPHSPPVSRLGAHKELGGDTAGTGDSMYPAEYSISYGNTELGEQEGSRGAFSDGVRVPKSLLSVIELGFLGVGWTPPYPWEIVNDLLCLCVRLLLYL